MKLKYSLISGLILGAIALGWIVFLVCNEENDEKSSEARDMVLEQLNNVKTKVEKRAESEKKAPEPTKEAEPVDIKDDEPEVTPVITAEPSPFPVELPEHTDFDYIVVCNVENDMNIREGAGTEYSIVGTIPLDGYGRILERTKEWFKIKSGKVTGYVKTDYLLTDTDAIRKIREKNALKIKVVADEIEIRKEPNTGSEVVKTAKKGELFDYYPEFSNTLFYAVMIDEEIYYVHTQYTDVNIKLKTASKVK